MVWEWCCYLVNRSELKHPVEYVMSVCCVWVRDGGRVVKEVCVWCGAVGGGLFVSKSICWNLTKGSKGGEISGRRGFRGWEAPHRLPDVERLVCVWERERELKQFNPKVMEPHDSDVKNFSCLLCCCCCCGLK